MALTWQPQGTWCYVIWWKVSSLGTLATVQALSSRLHHGARPCCAAPSPPLRCRPFTHSPPLASTLHKWLVGLSRVVSTFQQSSHAPPRACACPTHSSLLPELGCSPQLCRENHVPKGTVWGTGKHLPLCLIGLKFQQVKFHYRV